MASRVDKVVGQETLKCIACAKIQGNVRALILIRDDLAICDECVIVCFDMLAQRGMVSLSALSTKAQQP